MEVCSASTIFIVLSSSSERTLLYSSPELSAHTETTPCLYVSIGSGSRGQAVCLERQQCEKEY